MLSTRPRVLLADDYPGMVKAVSPIAGTGLRGRGKRRGRQRTDGGSATTPARRDCARPEPPERPRTGGVPSDHANEPRDENHRVHGYERSGRQATIVRGRRVCLRVKTGARRRPAGRPSNACVPTEADPLTPYPLPLAPSPLLARLPPEDERSESRRRHDVEPSIAIQIDREDIRTGSGMVVNQLWNEFRAARRLRVPHRSIPVQHRRRVRLGIDIRIAVRPEPFAHDEVGHAVAIDVAEARSVWLREGDAAGVFR